MVKILWLLAGMLFFPVAVRASTVTVTNFLYDGSGNRVARAQENGNHTYYVTPDLEVTMTAAGQTEWRRTYTLPGGTTAVAEQQAGAGEELYYVYPDYLGSSSLVTSASGSATARQTYYPYGTTRTLDGTLPLDRQYTGQVSDIPQTGIYYYNARYYHPTLGKFTQADTVNDQLNRYAYVGNNPINLTDPSGNRGEDDDWWPSQDGESCDWLCQIGNWAWRNSEFTAYYNGLTTKTYGSTNTNWTAVQGYATTYALLMFASPAAAEVFDNVSCVAMGGGGECVLFGSIPGPSSFAGTHADEATDTFTGLEKYIDEGAEMIKAERYEEAIEHFQKKSAADGFGIDLTSEAGLVSGEITEAQVKSLSDELAWVSSSSVDRGAISVPAIYSVYGGNIPQSMYREVALLNAEEWIHQLQRRLPISLDSEIHVAKYLIDRGVDLGGTRWVQRYGRNVNIPY